MRPSLDEAGGHGIVGRLVDNDETASRAVLAIGFERKRLCGLDGHAPNVVEPQRIGRLLRQRIDIDAVAWGVDQGLHRARAVLEEIRTTAIERLLRQPTPRSL